MLDLSSEVSWKRFLSEHPRLKELAIEAGVENNPRRALELNCAYSLNSGDGVVMSEAEIELARYLHCREFEKE